MPPKHPLFQTLTGWLFLDYLNASDLIFGVFITLFALLWVLFIISLFVSVPKEPKFKD
jgi:hypothetical protein